MTFTYSSHKIILEYIWLGGQLELRSKTRIINHDEIKYNYNRIISLYNIPDWDYDGGSTEQATTENSEVVLKPCAMYRNPININNDSSFIVLCSTYSTDGSPIFNNYRHAANEIFTDAKVEKEIPWFGLEQEYFIYDMYTHEPLGFNKYGHQGQFYCSVGGQNAFGRKIVEEHLKLCLDAGLNISGVNAEVAPGQWEFQIGPCEGITAGDELIVARYLLERVSENHNVYIVWHPKPLPEGDYNGSGCHTNYSTKTMREPGGLTDIYSAIKLLELTHDDHMLAYGEFNRIRLTGKHETSSFTKFTSGIADRTASIRIGSNTVKNGYGYFEDRRPASNMDPYLVTSKICETTILNREKLTHLLSLQP
jgi:glutamine synthetase